MTKNTRIGLTVSVVVVAGLAVLLRSSPSGMTAAGEPLVLYCAAGIKAPVEKAAQAYEQEYGVSIQLQYGGSGTLLSNLRIAQLGDLYLAADDSYITLARERGLMAEAIPLARQRPVIAVAKGNPKKIRGIDDLLREDVRVALANPDAAAVGKITRAVLREMGQWEKIEQAAKVFKPTVSEVANDIKIGSVDAGIIWDATANQYAELDLVRVPALDASARLITIGVLTSTEQPTAALRFARYLGAADKGLRHFKAEGYEPVDGDPWAEHPEVLLFSGSMLRPGLDQALEAFEDREGVTVNRVYNGCGILVSQMRSGAQPDSYVSCDVSFMEQVQDRFMPARILTENDMVILVKKGNPKNVQSLKDLSRQDLQVGLAHPERSALGALCKRLLTAEGLYDSVAANLQLDSATGDFLVNQIRAGSLDAVIVYRSNAKSNPANLEKFLDIVEIDREGAKAEQPFAIARDTKYKHLLKRLFDRVLSAESQAHFESYGFVWRAEPE